MADYKLLFSVNDYPERTEEEQSIPTEIWYRDQDIKMLLEDKRNMIADIQIMAAELQKFHKEKEDNAIKIIVP